MYNFYVYLSKTAIILSAAILREEILESALTLRESIEIPWKIRESHYSSLYISQSVRIAHFLALSSHTACHYRRPLYHWSNAAKQPFLLALSLCPWFIPLIRSDQKHSSVSQTPPITTSDALNPPPLRERVHNVSSADRASCQGEGVTYLLGFERLEEGAS